MTAQRPKLGYEPVYRVTELARCAGWDRRRMRRHLENGGVTIMARRGSPATVELADVDENMPKFTKSIRMANE